MSDRLLVGDDFIKKVCESVGENPADVRRVVIDASWDSVVMVFVERYGMKELLEVSIPESAIKVEVSLEATND
jgi:hypothetical protein